MVPSTLPSYQGRFLFKDCQHFFTCMANSLAHILLVYYMLNVPGCHTSVQHFHYCVMPQLHDSTSVRIFDVFRNKRSQAGDLQKLLRVVDRDRVQSMVHMFNRRQVVPGHSTHNTPLPSSPGAPTPSHPVFSAFSHGNAGSHPHSAPQSLDLRDYTQLSIQA